MNKLVVFLLIFLFPGVLSSQSISLGCKSSADVLDLDRKAWNPNPAGLSEAYMHDFQIPFINEPCKVISEIQISITASTFENVPDNCFVDFATNIFVNCAGFSPGACNDFPPDLLDFQWGIPSFVSIPNTNDYIQFGDAISIDLVGVLDLNPTSPCPAYQYAITLGLISINYTICVDVIYEDGEVDNPLSLPGDFFFCRNETAEVDAGFYAAYQWDDASFQTTQVLMVDEQGNYTVTVTDFNGCTATDDIMLSFFPGTFLEFEPDDMPISKCANDSLVLEALISNSYMNLEWDLDDISISNESVITITDPGDFNISFTDTYGCDYSEDFSVVELASPDIEIDTSFGTMICKGDSVLLSAMANNLTGNYNWTSSSGAVIDSFEIFAQDTGLYSVVFIDDATACKSDTLFVDVQFQPSPSSVFQEDDGLDVCQNNCEDLIINISSIGPTSLEIIHQYDSGSDLYQLISQDSTDIILRICTSEGTSNSDTIFLSDGNGGFHLNNALVLSSIQDSTCQARNTDLDTVTVRPVLSSSNMIEMDQCKNDGFELMVGMDLYNESNPSGTTVLQNNLGCDSTVVINLNYLDGFSRDLNSSHCVGDGYEVQIGQDLYNESNPIGSTILLSAAGCDSTINVNLEFLDQLNSSFESANCSGSGFSQQIGMDLYDESNPTGTSILQSSLGCDSIVEVELIFIEESFGEVMEQVCSGSGYSIQLNNMIFDESNPVGVDTLLNVRGCDSIVNVELEFLSATSSLINTQHCLNDNYMLQVGSDIYNEQNPNGQTTILNANGCDSIVTVDLIFESELFGNIESSHCKGEDFSIQIGPDIYDETNPSGSTTITSSQGCDSTVTVTLNFIDEVMEVLNFEQCMGDGFEIMIGSDIYNESNPNGTSTLVSNSSCDSLVMVSIDFLPGSDELIEETLCIDGGYELMLGNDLYNQDNPTGTTVLQRLNGCDSIINVSLNYVLSNPMLSVEEIYCSGGGDQLVFGNDTYNEANPSGITNLIAANGCDSIIEVNLIYVTPDRGMEQINLCQNESIIYEGVQIDINNQPLSITILNASQNGCDSIVDLSISFDDLILADNSLSICEGDSILIAGSWIQTTGSYLDTISSISGCDTVLSTNLTVVSCNVEVSLNSLDALCHDSNDGVIEIALIESPSLPVNYELNLNSSSLLSGTLESLNEILTVNNLEAGDYELILLNGTNEVVFQQQIVINAPEAITVSSNVVDLSCFGDSDGAIDVLPAGGTPNYNFDWSEGSSGSLVENLSAGAYILTVTDINECSLIESYEINQPAAIGAIAQPEDISCAANNLGSVEIVALVGGNPDYSFSIDDGLNYQSETIFENLNEGEYAVLVKDDNDCELMLSDIQIELVDDLSLSFQSSSINGDIGDSIAIQPTINFELDSVVWIPDSNLSCSDCLSPILYFQENTLYTIISYAKSGCVIEHQIEVTVNLPGVYIPNSFSPNEDGNNDSFGPLLRNEDGFLISMYIYDRWGNKIYSSDNSTGQISWNGRSENDNELSNGVYVYQIMIQDANNNVSFYKGDLLLLR